MLLVVYPIILRDQMRADIFHASSLLLKYGEYSEANLTHEVSRLLSEKTNLTEALGVSAQLGSVMQATYEEMMESGVFEMKSKGILVQLSHLWILWQAVVICGVPTLVRPCSSRSRVCSEGSNTFVSSCFAAKLVSH